MKSTNDGNNWRTLGQFFYLPFRLLKLHAQNLKLRIHLFYVRREQRILLLRLGYPLPKDGNYYWPGEQVAEPAKNGNNDGGHAANPKTEAGKPQTGNA